MALSNMCRPIGLTVAATLMPIGTSRVPASARPIRQIVQSNVKPELRYLVIMQSAGGKLGAPVQVR